MSEALCQVCGEAVVDEKVYCSRCHAPHHKDCWEFNKGCSIFGCGGVDCLKVPVASDSAGEFVYIGESTVPPALPTPEANRQRKSLLHDSRMIWVVTLVAVLSLGSFEREESPRASASRPSRVRKLTQPGRPLFQATLKRDVTDAAGRVDIPAGTRVQVFAPDADRRYRIRAEGRPDRWVFADAFERHTTKSIPAPPFLFASGVGQILRDLPELPRGQFVMLSGTAPIQGKVPGLTIRADGQQAWTEQQRFVLLEQSAFQRVRAHRGLRPMNTSPALARSMWPYLKKARPPFAIVVERTTCETGWLEPGTFLKVAQLESSGGEPAYVLGDTETGRVRVPASACRPVLASALQAEAAKRFAAR